jgi:hypothetical protein
MQEALQATEIKGRMKTSPSASTSAETQWTRIHITKPKQIITRTRTGLAQVVNQAGTIKTITTSKRSSQDAIYPKTTQDSN